MPFAKYHNVAKFLMSGGVAALAEYLSFVALHHLGMYLIAANALSFSCGLVISFTLNKHWVFSRKGNGTRQFAAYFVLALVNLVLGSGLIVLLAEGAGLAPLIAKVITMGVIATWNYVMYQKIIFKAPNA